MVGDLTSKERVHDLKCWPPYFAAVADGSKPFEVRLNDRDYHVDDILRLREWDYDTEVYTGREVRKRVTYMTAWAQQENHVVMGLADVSPTHEPPAEPVGFVARSKVDGTIFRDFAKPGECHPINDHCEWMPVYARPAPPPAASQDAVRLRQFVESAGEQCNCADVIVDLRAALAGEWLYQQLPGWDPNNPTARPAETKSETVMSKVREHFDAQRDRDGYHSELERLEFAPPADPGPRCTCSDFHGAHEYCRAHETRAVRPAWRDYGSLGNGRCSWGSTFSGAACCLPAGHEGLHRLDGESSGGQS